MENYSIAVVLLSLVCNVFMVHSNAIVSRQKDMNGTAEIPATTQVSLVSKFPLTTSSLFDGSGTNPVTTTTNDATTATNQPKKQT